MAYQHEDGRLTAVSCGCPNLCRYCSWRVALENAVVVKMDAEIRLPEIGFTLTTKATHTAPATFRNDVRLAFRALRRRFPGAQYLGQIEFTTGEGTHSGGARRIHQHGLLKGVPRERAEEVGAILREVWHQRTGAHRVEAHELHRPAGAIAYLVNHHQKSAQTPPKGWSGKRLRPSKGYYEHPIAAMRERAKAILSAKVAEAEVDRWLDEANAWEALDPCEYDSLRDELLERASTAAPVLVRTMRVPSAFGEDGLPSEWTVEVVGLVEDERAA
jgi:hypothetical protein